MLVPDFATRCEVAIQNNQFSILLNIMALKRQLGQMLYTVLQYILLDIAEILFSYSPGRLSSHFQWDPH